MKLPPPPAAQTAEDLDVPAALATLTLDRGAAPKV